MRLPLPAVLALLLVVLPACSDDTGASNDAASDQTTIPFEKEGRLAFVQDGDTLVALDIEVADTDSARERGMMQRDGFPSERSGMLFPFSEEKTRSFWMANTPLALDLFFLNADSRVVRIKKYAQPNSASSIPSKAPAQYVLETGAGVADSYGIVEGARARWRRTDE
ncbi:MAG: DUF192 domain-containing protein [Bacteroidetes bacterium SW_9_63_38]|nr:MAG: DUF192 domain-containing protein [Bacteroidetes bacterium SW_9_63_38]